MEAALRRRGRSFKIPAMMDQRSVAAHRIILLIGFVPLLSSCCLFGGYRTPDSITTWQDVTPSQLSLAEKAARFQDRIVSFFRADEGFLRYRRMLDGSDQPVYGNLADGTFHTGIYVASQALRYATTRSPESRQELVLGLDGLKFLMDVTGKPGLLSRHCSPATAVDDPRWLPSPTDPGYMWRSDVSKDQYAGFALGIGVTAALIRDPDIRERVGALASAATSHLRENDLQIIDTDGERTTFGDLDARIWGIPIGVNALIVLAIAKVAAVTSKDPRDAEFYAELVDAGLPDIGYWAHFSFLWIYKRVNDNMGYQALYPLLLLEDSEAVATKYRASGERSWKHLAGEHNAFFGFVHAALVARHDEASREVGSESVDALFEFPESKIPLPIDLTREGFDIPQAFFTDDDCRPRSREPVPLYMRSRSSNFWGSDPYRMVANIQSIGNLDTASSDYLLAYWMGRYHGFVTADQ